MHNFDSNKEGLAIPLGTAGSIDAFLLALEYDVGVQMLHHALPEHLHS